MRTAVSIEKAGCGHIEAVFDREDDLSFNEGEDEEYEEKTALLIQERTTIAIWLI